MRRRSLLSTLVISISMLASRCGRQQDAPPPPPPPVVEVAPVTQKNVPIYGSWPATLEGYVNAEIQPEVTGYLIRQDYHEGTYVQTNQVLFEIDPRPFQAVLDQAKGQLAQAEAQLGEATLNVKRDIPEAQAHAIPQSQLDNDTQAKLAAEATVQADKAAIEQAQLNLGYTRVRSLIGGIAGIAQVQVGNLVTPASVLTGVSQVDPIKAYFQISGVEWLRMAGGISSGAVNLLSGAKPISLQLVLSNGKTFGYAGRILFADRAMNLQTGTIQIVGDFPNPRRILRPEETVTVRAVAEMLQGALLVPQPAVMQLQGSYLVAVVGPDNRVSIRSVEVGPQVKTLWVITHGLEPSERVVVVGAEKVRNGMVVKPVAYKS
ncbi:MAG TPA: efflux RND transporter periplasmic adaptor subunit [Terriglobia bacterium]|nr:efflux RND transporter periplasmic adaptor subunit [Terriglobia bacterium]